MMKLRVIACVAVVATAVSCNMERHKSDFVELEHQFHLMNKEISKGWNSYDTRSVFTQVYLPECFGIQLSLLDARGNEVNDLRVGNKRDHIQNPDPDWKADVACVRPWNHAYDGSYSEVDANWHGVSVKLRCAARKDTLVMLVTPLDDNVKGNSLKIIPCLNWDCINVITSGDDVYFRDNDFSFGISFSDWMLDGYIDAKDLRTTLRKEKTGQWDYYTCSLDSPVAISVGKKVTVAEAEALMQERKDAEVQKERALYGEDYDTYNAIQSILAWDTIYDPAEEVIISPVSRNWSYRWATIREFGGYVLFDWDTFFASQMLASTGAKELAYSNVHKVLSSVDQVGFVPKFTADHKNITDDCSQPPVGSMSVWRIFEKYGERWFLENSYPRLKMWNEWWPKARQTDGLLCWGSDPVRSHLGERGSATRWHAVLESGLDNSHMYDDAEYNPETHQLNMQDVGLTAMYIMDCKYLAKIAGELGLGKDAAEFTRRAKTFTDKLQELWCEEDGMFYNRYTDSGEFCKRTSPTNFYVLLAEAATQEQADRMINEHLLNEEEFWGEWVIPNTPRNDPAFQDQDYWRGRIWGPTNYLVYMGLRNYASKEVTSEFAQKSRDLLLKGWLSKGYIYENWNAITGDSEFDDSSDTFYHWGALMGYIYLIEKGIVR